LEEDFSDQVDIEDEIAEELPMSDEFIEAESDDPEPEDTVESFYAEEHPAEEESVNYAEVSEPSEPDHLEVTNEPKEEADAAEPEAEVGATELEAEKASNETVSLSENKLKETTSVV